MNISIDPDIFGAGPLNNRVKRSTESILADFSSLPPHNLAFLVVHVPTENAAGVLSQFCSDREQKLKAWLQQGGEPLGHVFATEGKTTSTRGYKVIKEWEDNKLVQHILLGAMKALFPLPGEPGHKVINLQ